MRSSIIERGLFCKAALILFLLAGLGFYARAADPVAFRSVEDVVYGHKDGLALTFDVLTPEKDAKNLGVILVSSGGWKSSKSDIPEEYDRGRRSEHWVQGLLKGGYTIFLVRHGSGTRYHVPEMTPDIRRSVRFIRLHAADYGIDPGHLGITSGSSGGHLALMTAFTSDDGDANAKDPVERVSSRVQAVVGWFPPTDLLNWGAPEGWKKIQGLRPQFFEDLFGKVTDLEAQIKSISPIYFASASSPPLLLIHGDKDATVPLQQSEVMKTKYDELGLPVKLVVHPGGGHTYWPGIMDDYPAVWEWFDKHLSGKQVASAPATIKESAPAEGARINQIQVIGTHNSYHQRKTARPASKEWDYAHPPLDAQLSAGVRSFELDLHLRADGWHVFHVPQLDDNSSCPLLVNCLETVKRWSAAHPRHVPISFLCEIKEEGRPLDKTILDFDASAADKLDKEIRSVFGKGGLIVPDDVRGGAATLADGARGGGWPLLEASRGKVFFILHEDGPYRDVYVKDRPSLEGRAMFVRSAEERPDCAALVEDTPNAERIQRLVKAGYFVRTRADGNLSPRLAPPGMSRPEAALASGAQIISTDYPPNEPKEGSGFFVGLPGNAPARCNPVNAPSGCGDLGLE